METEDEIYIKFEDDKAKLNGEDTLTDFKSYKAGYIRGRADMRKLLNNEDWGHDDLRLHLPLLQCGT